MRSKIVGGLVGVVVMSAAVFGGGIASATTAPNVVGMSEANANAALDTAGAPHSIISRSGSSSRDECTVTEQRDLGYHTEVAGTWNTSTHSDYSSDTEVWDGIGVVLLCR
jgi:hypothetical protein